MEIPLDQTAGGMANPIDARSAYWKRDIKYMLHAVVML